MKQQKLLGTIFREVLTGQRTSGVNKAGGAPKRQRAPKGAPTGQAAPTGLSRRQALTALGVGAGA